MQSNRKSRRDFVKEAKGRPYELELENPPEGESTYVTFKNPNRLDTQSAFELNREADPEMQLRILLSEEDFALFWAEWRSVPVEETNALLEDVFEHFGVSAGKQRR